MASRPDGDVWNIVDNDKDSQHYGRNFKFDFSYISSKEIKDVVKDYVWQNYRVGNKTIGTLYANLMYFKFFEVFAKARGIKTLKELGQEPAYQVQAVKYKYLKPLVESLEVQLNGKESVG